MIFLVNLDAAAVRRRHMLAQLDAFGLEARRIGVDCRTLTRRQMDALAADELPGISFDFARLSGAEIGCWMSHLIAWSAFLAGGSSDACTVIEDDVILEPQFAGTIDALARQRIYDIVFLGTSSKNFFSAARPLGAGIQVREPGGPIYNTWGYVVRRDYVRRFLAARPLCLSVPIDHVLGGRSGLLKPRVAVVQPVVVREQPELARASQIAPYTRRIDRWRLVEGVRRAFLESRISDWYYALIKAL